MNPAVHLGFIALLLLEMGAPTRLAGQADGDPPPLTPILDPRPVEPGPASHLMLVEALPPPSGNMPSSS